MHAGPIHLHKQRDEDSVHLDMFGVGFAWDFKESYSNTQLLTIQAVSENVSGRGIKNLTQTFSKGSKRKREGWVGILTNLLSWLKGGCSECCL